jgi:hypothetical protein
MKRTLAARAIVYVLVLFLILPGCATTHKTPIPEEPTSLGTIGVTRAFYLPETDFAVPAKGRPDGAIKGAASAFAGVMIGGMQVPVSGEAAGFYLLFLLALATAATPVGAVVGVVRAMPGKEAASSEALAKEILERMRTQEVLRGEILGAGIEKSGHRLIPVDGVGPSSVDNVVTYKSLAGKGIDTVLEVALQRIALESEKWGSNPPLKFTMKARCRLVRVEDGTVIDDHEYQTSSTERRFTDWTSDNAALLGKEYVDGYRKLASAIIQRIFQMP